MRRAGGFLAAAMAGFVVGAVLTLATQGRGQPSPEPDTAQVETNAPPVTVSQKPETFLAWTPGGLPAGFGERAEARPNIDRVAVVRNDVAWLSRSFSAEGNLVDRPPRGFAIPLDVAAVDPRAFAHFLPPADRGLMVALGRGQGILGASSAELRGLGPGATLEFTDGVRVPIAAVLPDELVGANELMVSRDVGRSIGVVHDRYALLQPDPVPTSARLRAVLSGAVAAGKPVRVRAPGETPYFRQGDAVLPPVALKRLFGEFAARPGPGGTLQLDPAWVRAHIATRRVPLLGAVRCNGALFPQLIGAMRELERRGLGGLVRTYHGCYVPKRVLNVPSATISHHTWGVAFDINLSGNFFGEKPHQDPRLVRILQRWGFIWGGRFIVPDGNHFEYKRPPSAG